MLLQEAKLLTAKSSTSATQEDIPHKIKLKNKGKRKLFVAQCSCLHTLFSCNFSSNQIAEKTALAGNSFRRDHTKEMVPEPS